MTVHCPQCSEEFDPPKSRSHAIESVSLFGTNLTIITCPRIAGWALVWNDGDRAPLWGPITSAPR